MEGETLAEENVNTDQDSSGSGSSRNPLLVILVLLNTLAVGAVGYFQYKNNAKLNSVTNASDLLQQQLASQGKSDTDEATVKTDKLDGLMYPLEPFTANLAQSDGPKRYIRMSLVMKFTSDTKKEEVDARNPQISDVIISMLNAKKPEELLKKEGKEYLKEEIKNAINNFLIDGHLEDIYYVGFQIN